MLPSHVAWPPPCMFQPYSYLPQRHLPLLACVLTYCPTYQHISLPCYLVSMLAQSAQQSSQREFIHVFIIFFLFIFCLFFLFLSTASRPPAGTTENQQDSRQASPRIGVVSTLPVQTERKVANVNSFLAALKLYNETLFPPTAPTTYSVSREGRGGELQPPSAAVPL